MSAFDKQVVKWTTEAETLGPDKKEGLLVAIKDHLDICRQINSFSTAPCASKKNNDTSGPQKYSSGNAVNITGVDYLFEKKVKAALKKLGKSDNKRNGDPDAKQHSNETVGQSVGGDDVLELKEYCEETLATYNFGAADVSSDGDEEHSSRSEFRPCEEIDEMEDSRRRILHVKRPSRAAICDISVDIEQARSMEFKPIPKSSANVQIISRVLERHYLFSSLDDSDIAKFASIMDQKSFDAGTEVIVVGESNDTFFIVLSGEAETTIREDSVPRVVRLGKGATFGDVALMYDCINEMTVVAKTRLECASLERQTYKMITSRAIHEKQERYVAFLQRVPFFSRLSKSELAKLAEALKEDHYVEGQKIISYGESGHWLHLIMEGTLNVIGRNEDGEPQHVATMTAGDFAVHLEFLYHHVSVADVVAASPVKTAKLSRRHFERLFGHLREDMMRTVQEDESYAYYRRKMESSARPKDDLSPAFDEPPSYVVTAIQHLKRLHEQKDDNDVDATREGLDETLAGPESVTRHQEQQFNSTNKFTQGVRVGANALSASSLQGEDLPSNYEDLQEYVTEMRTSLDVERDYLAETQAGP